MDKENQKSSAMPILADLVAMYVITGLLLVFLAALLGHVEMSDAAVSIGIIATYIVSCFAGGFLIGKKKKRKKYLWGLCVGAFYFAVLLLGNLAVNRGLDGQLAHMLATAVLCILSGMAGGMLS
ncbi:MAG: TIGR04086 family membrane protein [Eubacterium sp.]|nr:TIGR04086 family membrane protein [Eubacterium sp.]